jgi:hypothetical protein
MERKGIKGLKTPEGEREEWAASVKTIRRSCRLADAQTQVVQCDAYATSGRPPVPARGQSTSHGTL